MKNMCLSTMTGIVATFVLITMISGCDVIAPDNRLQTGAPIDSGSVRKVLLEEYTGFRCPNCPQGADAAAEALNTFKDKLIVISIHAGSQFAKPSGKLYTYDFRTAIGEALFPIFIGDKGQPNGTINRKIFNGDYAVYHTDWPSKIANELAGGKADMSVALTPEYDTLTKILTVKTNVKYKNAGSSSHKIAVYLIEDSIVFYQKDIRYTPNDRPDYVHRHVLRGAVGEYAEFGKQISVNSIAAGASFDDQFTMSFNGKDWKPERCSVVAFVNDANTYEVLQAEEAKVAVK